MDKKILFFEKINAVLMLCVLVSVYAVNSRTMSILEYQNAQGLEQAFIRLDAISEQLELFEKPAEMPPVVEKKPPRYGFTEDDIYLLTVLLCGSASKDGDGEYDIDFGNRDRQDQISLVLAVVMNRVRSPKFPNTVKEVVWAKNQFSVMPQWKGGLPSVKKESLEIVRDWCQRYDNWEKVQDIPEDHLYFKASGHLGIENISRKEYK